jgi:transcriptional regulator with XRE-family HTH domain
MSKLRTRRLCARLRLADAVRLSGYSIGWISEAERGLRKIRPDVEKRLLEIYRIERAKK